MKYFNLIFSAFLVFCIVILINAPVGLRAYYDEDASCSLIFHRSCCGYKNYFGRTKIKPIYDKCDGFIDGHASVDRKYRYKGYTADEWEWLADHPNSMFFTPSGEVIDNTSQDFTTGTCINIFGDYIPAANCSIQNY